MKDIDRLKESENPDIAEKNIEIIEDRILDAIFYIDSNIFNDLYNELADYGLLQHRDVAKVLALLRKYVDMQPLMMSNFDALKINLNTITAATKKTKNEVGKIREVLNKLKDEVLDIKKNGNVIKASPEGQEEVLPR